MNHEPDTAEVLPVIDFDADFEVDPKLKACIEAGQQCGPGLGSGALILFMSEYLHMRPKRHSGRPKGTWKRVPPEALALWKQGMLPSTICTELSIPYDKRKSFTAALNTAARRLPKELRQEVLGPKRRMVREQSQKTEPPS